jgi:ankyrin repeat protein
MLRKSLATLPRTLDQTYDRILTAIKEEDCIYAMRILQWLTFSARPLSIEEVAEVVAIDVERESKFDRDEVLVDPLEALDICSSLVTVTSKEIVREPPSRPLSPRDYDLDDYEEQDEERLPVFPFAHLPPPILQLPDPWERDPGDMLVNNSTRESVSMSDSQFSETRNTDYPGWLQLEDSAIANEATFSGESTPVLEMPPSPEYLPSYEYPYYPRSSRRARLHQPTFKRIISLAHYSVQEYLMSDRIKEGPAKQYSMQEVECHKAMAKGCLAYLVQLQQLTCTGLPTSDHALALYSARFWSSHLQKSGEDTEEVSQLATDLLSTKNPAYLTWLRFGDPDDDWKADGDRGLEDVATPLYYGALLGLSTTTKLLLERGAEVNALSGRYGNALQVASVRGHEVVVQTLIDAGADINASDGRALQLAFATDHEEVIKVLIGAGADVNTPHGEYGNALQAASVKGYNTVVKQLIDRGAEINAQGGTYGNALQAASAKGHENIVRMLLDTGALVNMQGGHHNNALCAALAGAYESTASMLLKSGANVGPDNWLKGAIHYAVDNPQCTLSSFSMLQRYGAPLDTVDSQDMTPMHYCVKHSHITIMRQLTDVGVSIDSGSPQTLPTRPHTEQQATHNFRNAYAIDKMVSARENPSPSHSNRISPLHYAIKAGYQVSLKALLSMGAKVALADERGLNALHYAARSRSLAVMKAILATEEAKFVNLMTLKDKYGQGVLHHALLGYPRAEVATIQWLLDQGADSSVLDNFGTTPLSAYIKDSRWDINLEILNVLLKTESSTSASLVDYDGKTSGHLSTSASALSALGFGVLKFLYSRGVDLSQKNHEERTVIHLAAIEGTLTRESLRFLIEVIGINADEEDIHGRTALQYTIEQAAKDRNPAWESRRWEYARDVLLEYARDVSLEYQSVRRHPVLKSFVVGV